MEQRRMDYHLHSVHSFDGIQTIDALCRQMRTLGVQELCLTEHIEPGHPDPDCDVPPVWDLWQREIHQAQVAYPELTIRMGVEIGDNPLCRAETMRLLRELELDYQLLSLHLVNQVDCYDAAAYYTGKTRAQAYREYAEAKAESVLAWEDFDCVAHIGYVARYSPWTGDEKPLVWQDAPDAFDAIFRRIIDLDKALEINTSGKSSTGFYLPHPSLIRRYIELGGEVFTFGSDAHDTDRDYENIEDAKDLVRSLGGKYQASYCRRVRTLYRI